MLRYFTAFSLLLTALSAPATAETFKDASGRFEVAVPTGWVAAKPEDARVVTFLLLHMESEAAPYLAMCMGMFMEVPSTRSQKQEELNEALDGVITPEFWRKSMSSGDDKFKMTIDASGSRTQGGRTVHYVAFTGTDKSAAKPDESKGAMELHFVPGAMHFVTCMANPEHYNTAAADFVTIFTSYSPRADVIVSNNESGPSVLTMFAKANFKGVARVLAQDTVNLAAAGWPTLSASLVVDGAEPWQVCSGAGYTGTCRTIVAAEAGTGGRPITVASARRISGDTALANIAATAIRRALQHPRTRAMFAN